MLSTKSAFIGVLAALLGAPATPPATRPAGSSGAADTVKRGEYLVHHVAMCIQCHSPRDEAGNLIRTQLLQGAPMPVKSPFTNQQWAFRAPKIAGLPGWSEEDAVKFLQTGRDRRGYSPQPPMPPFRMTQQDAAAVVAYLKSLE